MTIHVSEKSADRRLKQIKAGINTLAHHPGRCPEADEAADCETPLRIKQHGRRQHVFRIDYAIDGDTVSIQRVLHASQERLTADDL